MGEGTVRHMAANLLLAGDGFSPGDSWGEWRAGDTAAELAAADEAHTKWLGTLGGDAANLALDVTRPTSRWT